MSDYVNGQEAAAILGICYKTLWEWIQRGKLIAIKEGNKLRIHRSDLEGLNKHQRAPVLDYQVNYVDTGCQVSSTCLGCPLPACKHDDPSAIAKWRRQQLIEGLNIYDLSNGNGKRIVTVRGFGCKYQ